MKTLTTCIVLLIFSITLYAQPGHGDRRLGEEKNKFIKERLNLSGKQETEFFVLYDEFNEKRHDIRIEMTQNRLGLRKSDLSDKEARNIINNELQLKSKMVALEKEYIEKYYKILSPLQIIELYKADDDFNKIVMRRLRERRH